MQAPKWIALSVAACLLATSAHPGDVQKTGFVKDTGASERMNLSGKLQMLSQRIPATACYKHAGIEPDAADAVMVAAKTEFGRILKGLEVGDTSLGILGPETDRKVLAGLKKLNSLWDAVQGDIERIHTTGGTDAAVTHLAEQSHEVLRIAKLLVAAVMAEHSDPTAVLQADAVTIDIAGRQRMLAQRISKNACLLMTGLGGQGTVEDLAKARMIYDASVNALRFGLPATGIVATENPEILAKLDKVLALWQDTQPLLDNVTTANGLSAEEKANVYAAMNSLTGQMNTIVGLYTADSKLGL